MADIITNIDNPRIKYYRSLLHKKYRDEEGKFLIEGIRFVEEAINDNQTISQIEILIYTEDILNNDRSRDIINKAHNNGINTLCVNAKVLKSLAETDTPQGIIGVVKQQELNLTSLDFNINPLTLVVDGVQDPGNLGTIIRTAHGAGVDGIFLTKGTVDLYNSKVLRSTMGSIFKVKILKGLNAIDIINFLKEKDFTIMVADINESINYYDTNLKNSIALVVGNEGKGPQQDFIEKADERIIIPMPGGAESLNVAIAAGIILFEAVRQKLSAI